MYRTHACYVGQGVVNRGEAIGGTASPGGRARYALHDITSRRGARFGGAAIPAHRHIILFMSN
jgi:hypothetical protein